MNQFRPDVVFDCNIFLQAISRSSGPAPRALLLVERNVVTLQISRAVLSELRRTLAYPEIREKNRHVTDEMIDAFITHISFRGVLSRNVPRVFEFARDPSDEPYLDLSAAVMADYLVTRDADLLSLATAHTLDAKQFRQRLPQLSVLNPVDFVDDLHRRFPNLARSTD